MPENGLNIAFRVAALAADGQVLAAGPSWRPKWGAQVADAVVPPLDPSAWATTGIGDVLLATAEQITQRLERVQGATAENPGNEDDDSIAFPDNEGYVPPGATAVTPGANAGRGSLYPRELFRCGLPVADREPAKVP